MRSTRRALFAAALVSLGLGGVASLGSERSARADGPGDYGSYGPGPGAADTDPAMEPGTDPGQVYQPPPEGVCFDDNNQAYDCSKDEDFASYSQVDDGYDPVAYQDFRDTLMPHGSWLETAQYGQVWIPSPDAVGADFQPYYSNGRWVFTDYGWTWVSDYSWGWAPFHYGRWVTLANHGWGWVPGRVWGPAWVHWRAGGGYVGWAPLPPRGVRIAPPVVGARFSHWSFVPVGQLAAPRLARVDFGIMPGLFVRTTVANDFRAIGTTRIIVGPPAHHLPSVRITPSPLRMWAPAMPRAQIVVRPGVPLMSRPYYAPYRASYAPGYSRPGPGYRPGPVPPPMYRPGPGYQNPGPIYRPGPVPPPVYRPGPGYQNPGPMPPPVYRPGPPMQQNPGPVPPPVYRPSPPPMQQNPGPMPPHVFRPAPPMQQNPGPVYRPSPPPVRQSPMPPSPPSYRPSPPPVRQSPMPPSPPSYRPAPAPMRPSPPPPSAPSYRPPPSSPSFHRPAPTGGPVRVAPPT